MKGITSRGLIVLSRIHNRDNKHAVKRLVTLVSSAALMLLCVSFYSFPSLVDAVGNDYMCYGPNYNTCTWYNNTTSALQTKSSGSFTEIHAVWESSLGAYYLKQAGKSNCITWNASSVKFDQIACAGKTSQEFVILPISGNYYGIASVYNTYCMTGEGSGRNISLSPCPSGEASNQKWYWPVIT
jgi:hypothetical protein